MLEPIIQKQLLNRIAKGLPICERPFQELAEDYGVEEKDVIDFLRQSLAQGVTKRIGMVVNHHKVGYTANAMVVWDVPDELVDKVGLQLSEEENVRLCYQRPRRLPEWRYNLFTMIHGKSRASVLKTLEQMILQNNLESFAHEVLFSSRKFKQTGARYGL